MTPIIRRFVIKMLSKDQGSGITKLPNQMQVGFQESITTEKLVRNGYDPRAIRDETELKVILNRIDATAKQTREQKEKAMKQLADIMDMKGRKIPPGSKIMGGEAVDDIPPPGSRGGSDDIAAPVMNVEDVGEDFVEFVRRTDPEGAAKLQKTDDEIKAAIEAGNKRYLDKIRKQKEEGTYKRYNPEEGSELDREIKNEFQKAIRGESKLFAGKFEGTEDDFRDMLDEMTDDFASGGRVGLAAGGMGRRAFLKLMAAGGAGIAGLKSGLINIFKPRSQAVQEVVETVAKSDATGMPEHFMPLVNKIMNEGKLVKESDRIQTYKHPTRQDLELEYELDSGSVGVRFETDEGMPADYYLKKAVPDEGNPRGTGDEFFEGEMVYRPDAGGSYSKDFEEYISSGTTNLDEFTGVKVKDANKSKLPIDVADPTEFASGGIARMLGE